MIQSGGVLEGSTKNIYTGYAGNVEAVTAMVLVRECSILATTVAVAATTIRSVRCCSLKDYKNTIKRAKNLYFLALLLYNTK